MHELRLHGLDGVAARRRLACDRVATECVMAQGSKPPCPLCLAGRAFVAVDIPRKGPVLGEQELGPGISLAIVLANGLDELTYKTFCAVQELSER
jgi:hypothetical protein